MPTVRTRTVPYPTAGERKLLDVHTSNPHRSPCVLLWHGTGPDERDVMAPLAQEIAALGPTVFVPDWRSDSDDGGRSHLLDSLRYVRDNAVAFAGDPARLVLAGWSAGAGAAVGVALHPELFDGWQPTAVVGIAGSYDRPARSTGTVPLFDLPATAAAPVPVHLVHGAADPFVDVSRSGELLHALRLRDWEAELDGLADIDHAGIVMSEYDPGAQRCRRAQGPHNLAAGRHTAQVVAAAAAAAEATEAAETA